MDHIKLTTEPRRITWLDELPRYQSLSQDASIEIKRGERVVTITTASLQSGHVVVYCEGASEYWINCGESLPEAITFAERVFVEGAQAYS